MLYLSTSENVGRLEYAHLTIRFIKQLMSVALRPNRCRLRTIPGGFYYDPQKFDYAASSDPRFSSERYPDYNRSTKWSC